MFGLIGLDTDKKFSLQTVKVECSIYNLLVTCTSEYIYKNTTGINTDGLFSFPLDSNWVTYDFQSVIGGKTVVGLYKELEEAKKFHKAAIDAGQREVVIESGQYVVNTSKCCVGNIPNGSEVKISIKFATELKLSVTKSEIDDVDRFNLCLPMIARPRYTAVDGAGDDEIYHVANQFDYSFRATFKGKKEIRNAISSNHQMKLSYSNDKKTQGQVTLESKYDGTKDFVVNIDYLKINDPTVHYEFGTDQNDKGDFCKSHLAVVNFIPQFESKKMEIVFLVDRSDSMSGSDMQQAKKCVLYFLKNLPHNCMFQIYGFGTYFDKAFMQPQSYSDESLKVAMEYQKKMTADFDLTDFMLPLKHLFGFHLVDDYERVIFLLTDGDVSNQDQVVELIKENNASTTLYSIGLGPGVSGAFIKKMAAAGNGQSVILKNSATLPAKFTEIFDKAVKLNPFIVEKIEWQCPQNVTVAMVPENPEPVLDFNYLRFFCKVKDLKTGDTIKGKLSAIYNGKSRIIPIDISANDGVTDTDFTAHHLLTKFNIDKIMPEVESGNVESKKTLIQLSADANIATKYTTIVSIDKMSPNKGLLVPDKMDPLLYYKPLFKMENFTKKNDKNTNTTGVASPRWPTQIWIRSDTKEATHGNIIIFIADKQNIDGSWDYDPQLIWRLGLESNIIDENKPDFISNEIWMTMIVFQFIATKLTASEKEWQLLAKKAKEHICISIKESSIMSQIQSSDKFGGACDINGFIQLMRNKALFVLNEVGTPPSSQFTTKDIEGASSKEMAERRKYEIVFVIDRSGSMQGVKVESAKQCLYIFLKSLPDNCKFQIYGFGTNFDKAFTEYQTYDDDSIQRGLAYQYKIDASFGGTELLNPLRDLYSAPLKNEYTRLIFICTDGQISNENQAVDLVRQNNKLNRVFAIGIGKDVSRTLVNRLAEAGLGKANFVEETSVLSAVVIDLLQDALIME